MVMSTYADTAISAVLRDFSATATRGNINDPLFKAASRLYEFANAGACDVGYVDTELERIASAAGHDHAAIRATLRSAQKHVRGKAAVIPAPADAPIPSGYANLAAYATAHGVEETVFTAAGWSDAVLYEYEYRDKDGDSALGITDVEPLPYTRIRRALKITTDTTPRYRLIDEAKPKPKFWHKPGSHTDSTKTWYHLIPALTRAAQVGFVVLCNGEASTVVAQHYGVPALCETGGGEKSTPPQLLHMLRALWGGEILIALDGDGRGRQQAVKKVEQYRAAGYTVRAVDLGDGEDLATYCALHQHDSASRLPKLPDVVLANDPSTHHPHITQSAAIIQQLTDLGYTFRLNLCGNQIEVNGEAITDLLGAQIRTKLRDVGRKLAPVEDAYTAHAVANAYHPVKAYLEALTWDGVERIAQLADYVRGTNPAVYYADGTTRRLEHVYLHRWLIGAVAKVYEHAQNGVLVFSGAQGKGKSHFARWLCPSALQDRYFLEAAIDPRDKDASLRLMSMFIWEVGEIDATTRKADVSALKDFISQKIVTVRRSYGRYDTRGAALASLIGTVNTSDFLADDTGNRRFYVLDVDTLDWRYTQLDNDQLWAEALTRYRHGEPWTLLPDEQTAQALHNRRYLADGLMGDWLRRYCEVTNDPTHQMTAAEIVATLKRAEPPLPLSTNDRSLSMDISRACAALGVSKIRTASGRYYVGIRERPF